MIGILNINSGNLVSVYNKLTLISDQKILITSDLEDLKRCTSIIFPGVGNIKYVISNIEKLIGINNFKNFLLNFDTKILGICVGAQVMGCFCEEGHMNGLEIVKFDTIKITESNLAKVPHVGWNKVKYEKISNLFHEISEEEKFYFTHSYCMQSDIKEICLSSTFYNQHFISSFKYKNIYGVQFHPEKSHETGLKLLKNFIYRC